MSGTKNTNLLLKLAHTLPRLGTDIGKEGIHISGQTVASWQSVVDILADISQAPVSLIRRLDRPDLEVYLVNDSARSVFPPGLRNPVAGSICENAIASGEALQLPDTRTEPLHPDRTDREKEMRSYFGYPVYWPDGDCFGTVCIMDREPRQFNDTIRQLLEMFRNLIESHLAMLFRRFNDIRSLEFILDNLDNGIIVHDLERTILFFNEPAERTTGYKRDEVIGKDCHTAMGGPFCGHKCSFCGTGHPLEDKLEYSINITTRHGESRRLEMTSMLMRDDLGEAVGVLAVFRDVTELLTLRLQTDRINRFDSIVGRDSKMLSVFRQILDVADYDFPVHIYGETGTGKELVAHAIHNESKRGGGPFVPINCGALPEGLIESELFGHVKGAFSGAVRDKKGRFELAAGGTVFLDEIADLPKLLQVKLLRFLQEGQFEKVGGEKTISADVRIISATNKDLKNEVQQGNFREDLYYRLNVIPITIPPLRDRKGDVPLLVEHFLKEIPMPQAGIAPDFSKQALAVLMDYQWPGNVRELQNCVQFALVRSRGKLIRPEDLPLELRALKREQVSRRGPVRKLTIDGVERALTETGGNKAKAARNLGVGRATLYRFLDEHPDLL